MRVRLLALLLCVALPLSAQTPPIEQARALINHGKAQEAADLMEKTVAAAPKNAEAHYLLGSAYGQLAQKASIFGQASLASKTRDEFETAIALDPNHIEARFALLQYYTIAPGIMGGSESKAIEQANEIKKRDALMGHRAWAFIYNRQKKPDLARNEYVLAVREQPNSAKTHLALGVFYLGEKNYPAATTEIETAIKHDANYMPAWFRLGQLSVLSGTTYPRGEEALRKYLAYTPKHDEPPLYRAHYWLGQIYEKTGRKAEAKASFAASLRLNSQQKDVTEALKRVS